MKFKTPVFSNGKTYKISDVNGIVTSRHPSKSGLTRLSDGFNLWNKNGLLTTRPGIALAKDGIIKNAASPSETSKIFFAEFPFEEVQGYNRLCALVNEVFDDRTEIDFFVTDQKGKVYHLYFLELVGANGRTYYEIKNILFVKDTPINGSGLFAVIPIYSYNTVADSEFKEVRYYEFSSDYKDLSRIDPNEFYRPLILKHGFGNRVTAEVLKNRTTSYPEGVNILGGNFEACFTVDGNSHVFKLPVKIAKNSVAEIRMYISSLSYITFSIPIGSDSATVNFMQKDITVYLSRDLGEVTFMTGTEPYPVPIMLADNAVRVLAHCDTEMEAYELLSRNAKPISFDSRIFIPGGENRGNKIYYSGKNKPLYFCERNSITVGDTNYDLTALSLQSRYVIAFKEKELYRLSVTESQDVSREDLFLNNSIYEMPVPTYKITRINDSIGCDLPSTIVNCVNRLVWFHSDGAVYSLYGSNLYTEGSIYELSAEISDKLKNMSYDELRSIFASEMGGFYLLGVIDRLYIMDTRVSGFRYLSGSTADKGYSGLPWFFWKAPEGARFISAFLCGGNELFVMRTSNNEHFFIANLLGEYDVIPKEQDTVSETPPAFSLSTPIFGDTLKFCCRMTVNANPKRCMTFEVFDENGIIKTAQIKGGERLRSFIIPLYYKKGGVGLTIKGNGSFYLKDITLECNDRKY